MLVMYLWVIGIDVGHLFLGYRYLFCLFWRFWYLILKLRQCGITLIVILLISKYISHLCLLFVCLMVFNATFNNISAVLWRSVFLVEETGDPGKNIDLLGFELTTPKVIVTDCICREIYHIDIEENLSNWYPGMYHIDIQKCIKLISRNVSHGYPENVSYLYAKCIIWIFDK